MTKKRRNLRILASIIAAGCVWSAGMGNVWADVIGDDIKQYNYIAIGDADINDNPFIANVQMDGISLINDTNSINYGKYKLEHVFTYKDEKMMLKNKH